MCGNGFQVMSRTAQVREHQQWLQQDHDLPACTFGHDIKCHNSSVSLRDAVLGASVSVFTHNPHSHKACHERVVNGGLSERTLATHLPVGTSDGSPCTVGLPRFILNCFSVRVGWHELNTGVAHVRVVKTTIIASKKMNVCLYNKRVFIVREMGDKGDPWRRYDNYIWPNY